MKAAPTPLTRRLRSRVSNLAHSDKNALNKVVCRNAS